MCFAAHRKMVAYQSKLIELLDSRNGLLDKMLSAESKTESEKHFIEVGATDEIKNERLCNILRWKSLAS